MKIQTTKVYRQIENAKKKGYTTVSEQGSSRSSKTYNTVIWLIVRCLQHPGTTVSVVRKTLTAARRSVLRDFKDNMINMKVWNDRNFSKSDFIFYFNNGSWIEFFGADNEQKLRGSKRKILYVNEGNELTFLEWQQLQMRTTEFTIIDYNPSFSEDHWICDLNKEAGTYHFISTYKDNPFLEKKVVDEIESLKWKNPSLWRVYGLGLQAIIEGLIFENVEYVDEIPRWIKKRGYLGMDLGYSNDSTAISQVWVSGDELWIDEVCYKTHMLTGEIISTLKECISENSYNFKIISESADPRMIDEIYNAGLDIHPVKKYQGSVMAGIQKMQEMKIKVTKRSTNAIKEFKNYTYRQDKEGKWLNEPIDAFNHCFTGDTMIMTDKGNIRISDICEGDYVLTRKGYKKVVKKFNNGIKRVVDREIITNFAHIKLSATPDHLLNTNDSWKKFKSVTKKDKLYILSSITGKNIDVTQKESILTTITINGKKEVSTLARCYTMPSMKMFMERYQRAKLYIILIRIHSIMMCRTLWQSLHQNIVNCMKRKLRSLQKLEFLMALPKKIGKYVERKLTQSSQMISGSVSIADQISLQLMCIKDSAESYVTSDGNIQQKKISSKQNANGAEKSLSITNTINRNAALTSAPIISAEVKEIIDLGSREEEVYDLMVEDCHEYFANGVLVHNCIDGIRYVILSEVLGGYGQGLDAEEIIDML